MDKMKIQQFAEKVYGDMAGTMATGMVYVGVKTGLFSAMSGKGEMTADDVASASGLHPRYVSEWLAGMATAGYVIYNSEAHSFSFPDEHAYLLDSDGTDHYMGGMSLMAPVLLNAAPEVAKAFRDGGGVPFSEFGSECVNALDVINRGQYENRLTSYWLPAAPGVVEKLSVGGRVLDVGCGAGRICMAIARDFPEVSVVGLDPDSESIDQARNSAASEGLADHVEFIAASTGDMPPGDGFDLITIFDCVHDFSKPQQTLGEVANLLKPDGTLFIMEPKAADDLEDNIHALGTVYYGFSLFHCMTQSLASGGPGLGTCMGPAQTEALCREAGFSRFEQLPIKSQTNLFYAVGK